MRQPHNSSRLVLGLLMTAMIGSGTGRAALLSEESFIIGPGGYSAGDVSGQNPASSFFSGPWFKQETTHSVNVVEQGLVWPGLITSGGSLATGPNGRAGRNFTAPWNAATVGTYYISFLANFGVGGSDHRVVEGWSAPSLEGVDGTRTLMLGYSTFTGLGTTLSLSVNNGGDGIDEVDFNNNVELASDGLTHLFVLKLQLSDAPGGDSISGYMDPANLSAEPGSPNAVLSGVDFELAAFGGVVNFVFDGTPTSYIDEIRFGEEWADVLPVPEPGSLGLLGLGILAMTLARRKR